MDNSIYKIFNSALNAADPYQSIIDKVKIENSILCINSDSYTCYDLKRFKNIYLIGCGKAVFKMVSAIENILGEKINGGLAVTKYGYAITSKLTKVNIVEAGHPVPDRNGYTATLQISKILQMAGKDDLIIALLSGGGSSLWAMPVPQVTLFDLQQTTQLLVNSGADICQINTVRKHLSEISGGFAAFKAFPATVAVLVISDVIGDRLDTIASGPFFPDNTSFLDAIEILEQYGCFDKLENSVRKYLIEGKNGLHRETPEKDSPCFNNVNHYIIASNKKAISAAKICAENLGFKTIIIDEPTYGETSIAAKEFCNKVKTLCQKYTGKLCIIAGGETTVTLKNNFGKGGRNQEFALAAAIEISGTKGLTILSCGTDGTDGPTDANGAVVDGDTYQKCIYSGLDPSIYLKNHDSYTLFNKIKSLVKTGPTFTNVMDLQIGVLQN